jgi:hypothetical protein
MRVHAPAYANKVTARRTEERLHAPHMPSMKQQRMDLPALKIGYMLPLKDPYSKPRQREGSSN